MVWAPNLSWIAPDLAVGGSFPIEAAATLAGDHQIGAVIDLRAEATHDPTALDACGLRLLHLPTPDMMGVSQPRLDRAITFARAVADDGLRLLVHCEHGIGRSATAALCILVDRGLGPIEALSLAKARRSLISPSRSQYQAWATWLRRRGVVDVPTYHQFGMIAYRPLALSG